MDTNPQLQARDILISYFSLARLGIGNDKRTVSLESGGWTVSKHAHLARILAEGALNLAELAAGDWMDDPKQSQEKVAEGLERECRWLYDQAATLEYPALWDRDATIAGVWRQFWSLVAATINEPPRYGVPFQYLEAPAEIHARLCRQAEHFDMLRPLSLRQWFASLLGSKRFQVIVEPKAPAASPAETADRDVPHPVRNGNR